MGRIFISVTSVSKNIATRKIFDVMFDTNFVKPTSRAYGNKKRLPIGSNSFAVNFAAGKRKEAANACNLFLSVWAQRGMIPRPSDYESAALTD